MSMTIDDVILGLQNSIVKNNHVAIHMDTANAEQLLYWLTEYRAMISGRQSGNLSERLAEHLVWTESNSCECQVTLAEDLQEAISNLNDKDKTISNLIDNIKCLQNVNSWIPCDERMPEYPCIVADANGNTPRVPDGIAIFTDEKGNKMAFDRKIVFEYKEQFYSKSSSFPLLCEENRITHWMPLPEPPGGEENGNQV